MGDYRELILGAGHDLTRRISVGDNKTSEFQNPTTLDLPGMGADVEFDLNRLTGRQVGTSVPDGSAVYQYEPLPFDADTFDELHAYEVLEHFGRQGDYIGFFWEFYEFWRVLKPGGYLCGSVPHPVSPWAWGDPGHTRVLPVEVFSFLSQEEYDKQLGVTSMTDYRACWHGDFRLVWQQVESEGMGSKVATQLFALRAVK